MPQRLILLVEDNPDDQDLVMRSLRLHRITNPIRVAHDGQEAFDCLLGPAELAMTEKRPAFVLLDIRMPRVNGLQVLERLRADPRTQMLPVVENLVILSEAKELCIE